ncbi:MAG: DNA modification methylase [Phycisphaerales bacterium]|nr:DNA modification methylase [Phycisphaerales bacterium]
MPARLGQFPLKNRLPNSSAIRFEQVPIGKLVPAPYNPRVTLGPGDPRYERLARSVAEFGYVDPLIWNKRTGHVVGGNQRLRVLQQLGVSVVDVVVVDLPLAREKALNLALNRIAGEWDQPKLADLLQELLALDDFDIGLTGFDLQDARDVVTDVLGTVGDCKEEQFDVEAALKDAGPAVTKPGEVILLGRDPASQHRLMCGDCTDPAAVGRLMDGQKAAIMATDPPYLVDYDGTNHPGKMRRGARDVLERRRGSRPTKNKDWSSTYGVTWDDSDGSPQLYERFLQTAVADALHPHAAVYVWHASRRQPMLEAAFTTAGMLAHCQIIWVKNRPVLTRTWYAWRHEPCLMGWLKGNKPPRVEKSVLSTVWEVSTIPNGPERPDHPTPKPLELFEIPMRQHTRPGAVCYEPFAGSGTQVIAAQRLGRRCFALEVSPVYCDVIVRRFIAFAGAGAVSDEVARRYQRPRSEETAA